jgi:hypothetical protein
MGEFMIYFALNNDGLLYNLGDHGDYESADCCAQDMQIDAIWLIGENEARCMADFINETLTTTESTQ